MSSTTEQHYKRLEAMYGFCTTNPLPAPLQSAGPGFSAQIAKVKTQMDTLADLLKTQQIGFRTRQQYTQAGQAARTTLRTEFLVPIAATAGMLEDTYPGVARKFRVPSGNVRQVALLSLARAAVEEIAHPELLPLISAALGADFLDRFRAAIQILEAIPPVQSAARDTHITATSGANALIKGVRRQIRYLRSLVRAACHAAAVTDPVVATQTWDAFAAASRLTRKGTKKRDADATPVITLAPSSPDSSHGSATAKSLATSAQANTATEPVAQAA